MARRSLVALAASVLLVACAGQGGGSPGSPAFVPPSPTLTAAATVPSAMPPAPATASPSGTPDASRVDFRETGTLARDSPGLPPGQWHLVYERPGAPALTRALIFDATSVCEAAQVRIGCDALEPGTRVTVQGNARGDAIQVTTLLVERAP